MAEIKRGLGKNLEKLTAEFLILMLRAKGIKDPKANTNFIIKIQT